MTQRTQDRAVRSIALEVRPGTARRGTGRNKSSSPTSVADLNGSTIRDIREWMSRARPDWGVDRLLAHPLDSMLMSLRILCQRGLHPVEAQTMIDIIQGWESQRPLLVRSINEICAAALNARKRGELKPAQPTPATKAAATRAESNGRGATRAGAGLPTAGPPTAGPRDEFGLDPAWKLTPVADIGLSASVIRFLHQDGVVRAGELHDMLAASPSTEDQLVAAGRFSRKDVRAMGRALEDLREHYRAKERDQRESATRAKGTRARAGRGRS